MDNELNKICHKIKISFHFLFNRESYLFTFKVKNVLYDIVSSKFRNQRFFSFFFLAGRRPNTQRTAIRNHIKKELKCFCCVRYPQILIRERPHNTYAFRGEGGQRFVTKPCKSIGNCTVLRYEGGGGGQKS